MTIERVVLGGSLTGRKCGDCQLCCKLLPVRELDKGANTRCAHQRVGKGCLIYAQRPPSCRLWSCLWYADAEAAGDMRRPDRTHYVVDPMPDYVEGIDNGETYRIDVVQVWCDPLFPDAHRDPALRDYLRRKNRVALVRYSASEAMMIFPPAQSPTGTWWERYPQDGDVVRGEHSPMEIFG